MFETLGIYQSTPKTLHQRQKVKENLSMSTPNQDLDLSFWHIHTCLKNVREIMWPRGAPQILESDRLFFRPQRHSTPHFNP